MASSKTSPLSKSAHPQPLTKAEVEALSPQDVHDVLSRTLLVDGFDVVFDLEKSEGPYLYDSRSGKKFLDMFSFFASWPVSFNHPKLKDPKWLAGVQRVGANNPANSDIYTVEMAQFVATFERVAMPKEFKHAFFVQGGALAVENALKTAFDWKVRKNLAKGKGELGSKVIHFREAFHGRSGYTMSLTNTSDPNKWMYFPRFKDWPRVENPKAIFPLEGHNLVRTQEAEQRSLNQIKAILSGKDGDDVACILLEPVQGEGGDNHFRPEYWQALRQIADQYEVMLIADEVQAGMGLSGKFWSYMHYGATPDIVCFGKKSQVCGIMTTARVDEVKDNVFQMCSRINSTWGGNLIDMVRSRRFLEIIEEEKLVQNSAEVGAYLLKGLHSLERKFPGRIFNVRGKGLLVAFDVATPEMCSQVKSLAYQHGALIISCGVKTIRFRPVLDLKKDHVDQLITILDKVFSQIGRSAL